MFVAARRGNGAVGRFVCGLWLAGLVLRISSLVCRVCRWVGGYVMEASDGWLQGGGSCCGGSRSNWQAESQGVAGRSRAARMRACVCLCLWLLMCSVAAFGHADYASDLAQVGNAYVEKVHEMASAVNVLLGLSRDTSAFIAALNTQCV